jgi:hypothetical protein
VDNRLSSSSQAVANDYQQRLTELNQQIGFVESLKKKFPNASLNVLSIGCGDDLIEREAVVNFFRAHQLSIHFIGIDVDDMAIKNCKDKYHHDPHTQYHVLDGMKYDEIKKLFAGEIHVIVLRHPLLYQDWAETKFVSMCFNRILTTTVPYVLAEGGLLLTSLYHPEEKHIYDKLINLIATEIPVAINENKQHLKHVEERVFYNVTTMVDVYEDYYFYVSSDFTPSLCLQIEKANGCFENENPEVASIVQAMQKMHSQLYATHNASSIVKCMLQEAIHAAINQKSIQEIAKCFEVGNNNKEDAVGVWSSITWDLIKRNPQDPTNLKRYYSYANAIVKTVQAGGNANACVSALSLMCHRTILPAPQQKKEEDKAQTSQTTVNYGYGGGMGF